MDSVTMRYLVSAGRKAYLLDKRMTESGYSNNPYSDLYGEIAGAINHLVDDNSYTFIESAAYKVLAIQDLSLRDAVEMLMNLIK